MANKGPEGEILEGIRYLDGGGSINTTPSEIPTITGEMMQIYAQEYRDADGNIKMFRNLIKLESEGSFSSTIYYIEEGKVVSAIEVASNSLSYGIYILNPYEEGIETFSENILSKIVYNGRTGQIERIFSRPFPGAITRAVIYMHNRGWYIAFANEQDQKITRGRLMQLNESTGSIEGSIASFTFGFKNRGDTTNISSHPPERTQLDHLNWDRLVPTKHENISTLINIATDPFADFSVLGDPRVSQ